MGTELHLGVGLKNQIEKVIPQIQDVVLYINSNCNLRCRHCYVGNDLLNANNHFHTDEICSFIKEFSSLSRITVLGGEPFLHRGINRILESTLAVTIGERRVTTNLTDFFFFNYLQFSSSPITLAVSLDGADAISHDYIRGPGTFEKTMSNIKILNTLHFDIEVTHTITTKSIGQFDKILALCRSLGITKLNLHKMSLQGNARDNSSLYVQPSAWVLFCKRLEGLSISSRSENSIRVRYPPIHVTNQEFVRLQDAGEYWDHRQRSYHTAGGGHRVVLYPNGRVYVSSELFGTDSYIGTISDGAFVPNTSFKSELKTPQKAGIPYQVTQLTDAISGDVEFPVVLSVSFKRTVTV